MNKRTQWIAAAVLAVGTGAASTAQACGCHRHHVMRTTQVRTTRLAPVGEYTVIRERPVVVSRTWYNGGLAPVGERIITRRVVACPAPVGERVIVRRTVFPEPARVIAYRPAPVGERIITRRTYVMTSPAPVAEEEPGFFTSVGNVVSAPFRWIGGAFSEPVEPVGERVIVTHRRHYVRCYNYSNF